MHCFVTLKGKEVSSIIMNVGLLNMPLVFLWMMVTNGQMMSLQHFFSDEDEFIASLISTLHPDVVSC